MLIISRKKNCSKAKCRANLDDEDLGFFFTSPDDAAEAQTIYEIMESPGGLYSKPL